MKWRCVNDIRGYCSGEPEWDKSPTTYGEGYDFLGGSCKLNPKTCGKFQTLTEQLKGKVLPTSELRVVKGKIIRRKKVDKAT